MSHSANFRGQTVHICWTETFAIAGKDVNTVINYSEKLTKYFTGQIEENRKTQVG
jgi:hypothetical protein